MKQLQRAIIVYEILYLYCPISFEEIRERLHRKTDFNVCNSVIEKDLQFLRHKLNIKISYTRRFGYNLDKPVDIKETIFNYLKNDNKRN